MQYQIQTAPIWEAYRETDGCPLCKIFAAREKRIVAQYLGNARRGFARACAKSPDR